MNDATRQTPTTPWRRLGSELPSDLRGHRVLVVAPAGAGEDLAVDGADETSRWDPVGAEPRPDGLFDLVICAEAMNADPHPANLLTALCEVTRAGATMLLHARVLTDPEQSAFARFVAAQAGVGDTEWLPGRLALRWTVETNGFDIERWIDAGSSASRGEDDALLVATRTERTPSLVLATPVPVDGPSQERGGA